jgi:hypothetical protein
MSVDPYMRGRMAERESYVPPFQIDEVLSGGAVGQVVESNNPQFQRGDYVSNFSGWREWFVSSGGGLQKIDPAMAPIRAFLGVFGMPGLTAYAGLLKVGELKDGERVFVSGALGFARSESGFAEAKKPVVQKPSPSQEHGGCLPSHSGAELHGVAAICFFVAASSPFQQLRAICGRCCFRRCANRSPFG